MNSIYKKNVWITGASSGIGEALAYELSAMGCNLVLSARNTEALNRVKKQCIDPEKITVYTLDLSDYNNMDVHVQAVLELMSSIDILINNAGISQRSLIKDTQIAVDKKIMEINYLGTISLTKALLPHFIKKQNGYYVTVTSLMGKFGSPFRSSYCGAKHALHGFFDVLRMEHEKDGIAVTLVCPGFVQTNVAINALTGDGSAQNNNDQATINGMPVRKFVRKMIRAITKKKFEVYIGKKEVLGVYLKRFFPKLLHRVVLRSNVT